MDHAKVKATRIASAVAGVLMATSGAQADILTFKIDGADPAVNPPADPDLLGTHPDFVGNPVGLTGKGLFTILNSSLTPATGTALQNTMAI